MFNHSARRAVLLGGLLCAATLARAGCSVSEHASPDIREVVVQHGGYEISTAKCELLNRHNLRLAVTGDAGVLSDVSIGWYSRQEIFTPIGPAGQAKLRASRGAVVGCGALGSQPPRPWCERAWAWSG